MKALRSLLIASLLAVVLAAPQARAADESPYKFEFHGFVTGSLYMQNQTFGAGSGQGLLFYAPTPANAAPCKTAACDAGTFAAGTATKSGTFLGGDMRQSRYVFALSGPKVLMGATPKAYFEGDLLGGAGGAPLVESWIWRIRAAYAELKWSQFALQFGQFSAQLAFAQMPDSVSHIANPISFGAGNFGWRTLGVRGIYGIPLDGVKLEIAGEVVQSSWGNNNVPGASPATIGSGMATGIPQVELRVTAEGASSGFGWKLYGDILYEQADLKNFGTTAPNGVTLADGNTKTSASPMAYEVGGKFTFSPVWLAFNFYGGNGLGSMAGALLQQGDIKEIGYWANLGVNATKEFSIAATYGYSKPEEKDVRLWATPFANTNMRTENTLIAGQAKYLESGFALALEFITYKTKFVQGTWAQYQAGTNASSIKTDGYQIIASAGYFF